MGILTDEQRQKVIQMAESVRDSHIERLIDAAEDAVTAYHLWENVFAGKMHPSWVNGEVKFRISDEGIRDVEERLLP